MINAFEAKRKVVLQTSAKKYMDEIEKSILRAVDRIELSVSIPYSTPIKNEVLTMILDELKALGYIAKYDPAKPCPNGCRSDQWDYNDYLRIYW